jgi:hypothetical protein
LKVVLIGAAGLLAGTVVFAQEADIVGKYSGSWTGEQGQRLAAVLDIRTVEGNKVTGVLERFSNPGRQTGWRPCDGEYPVSGTLRGNELNLITTEPGGRAGDCRARIRAAVQGDKLVGTIGRSHVELSK